MPKKLISAMLMLALLCSSLAIPQDFHLTASADDATYWNEREDNVYKYADFSPFTDNNKGKSSADPYTINTAAQLAALAILVNEYNNSETEKKVSDNTDINNNSATCSDFQGKYIKLTDDIDLAKDANDKDVSYQWVPIGLGDNDNYDSTNVFKGNFDGQGHEIKNMHIGGNPSENGTAASYNYAGLFGFVQADNDQTVTIQNVNIGTGSWVYTSGWYAGGICAFALAYANAKLTISNCCNSANITASPSSSSYAGGICARANATADGKTDNDSAKITISNCCNSGQVSSSANAGGICAFAYADDAATITISNCCNSGNITASSSSSYAGGICAYAYALADNKIDNSNAKITISNCCNSGSVTATSYGRGAYAGGICAYAKAAKATNDAGDATITISNCYYLDGCVGTTDEEGNFTSSDPQKGIGNKGDQTGTTALPEEQMKAAAKTTGESNWKPITVKDTEGNTLSEYNEKAIPLVDALNAWVDKNNNAKNSAFTAVTWQTADNNSIYPVLMIFPYVSFQTTLGYEIQSGYYTNQDKVKSSTPTLEKLKDNNNKIMDSEDQISWSKSIDGINLYKENPKTPELNIITAQYKVGESPVEVKSDTNQIVEVVDNGTLYVGVFETEANEGVTESDKVVGINPKSTDNFLCWVGNVDNDKDLEVLSYRDTYYFYARSDRTIIAVYSGDKIAQSIAALKDKPADTTNACANIESVTKLDDGNSFKVISMCSAPDGNVIREIGLLATKDNTIGESTSEFIVPTDDDDSNIKTNIQVIAEGGAYNAQHICKITCSSGNTIIYIRAYAGYNKSSEDLTGIYSDISKITLNDSNLTWDSKGGSAE